jgi:peptidoglycan/LPS O-acetylase OafA/YrhL
MNKFRPDIEGLRGIAVLLVVLYHASTPFVSGGFIGVDVFFVISGYLITGQLLNESAETGRIDLFQFYARRARRLLPAAALTLVASLLAGLFIFAPLEQRALAESAAASALYCSNIFFGYRALDYMAADTPSNPFLHMWSLAVEEQFYLVWPLLIMIILRCLGTSRARVCLAFGVLAALSFAGNVWLTLKSPTWAFFSSPTRAWEFALGGIAQYGVRRSFPRMLYVAPMLGLVAILGSAAWFSNRTPFPGTAALIPVIGAAAVLHFHSQNSAASWVLNNPVAQFLGRMSYSWYLWHWPILVFASIIWKLTIIDKLLCAIVALALAAITHTLVENPIRFHRVLLPRPRLTLSLALGLTVSSVLICGLCALVAKRLELLPGQIRETAARNLPRPYAVGCHLSYLETKSPSCAFGDTASSATIVLFGDSHAAQWFPALERIAIDRHWKLVSLTKSACPVVSTHIYDPRMLREYTECWEWRERTIKRIIAMHPEVVVLSSYSTFYLKMGVTPPEWEHGLQSTLTQFNSAGVRTMLIHDPPGPTDDVTVCLARADWMHTSSTGCNFIPDLSADAAVKQAENEAIEDLSRTYVDDLSGRICATKVCDATRNNMILYRDASHLTTPFVLSLAPYIVRDMDRLVTTDHFSR